MPATSRCSPMAAPARCMRSRSPARSACATVIIPPAPGRVLRLRHAVLRSALRFRAHLVHPLDDARFDDMETRLRELEAQGRRAVAARRSSRATVDDPARRRHALCRPGARGDGRPADARVREARTAQRSSGISMTCMPSATAHRRPTSPPRSSACASTVTGMMRKPPLARSRAAAPTPPKAPRHAARAPVYFARAAASSRRRPIARAALAGRQPHRARR